ncbi:sugar kinase [Croceicoccus naphthovorans]|uniref:2-keto-3-deoxygluconate kinase n=1 Tax=Croceicoccus naphthovorans TaxID=1348774 RepID=A0A0G3XCZ6_9SPHN|nr:sugar kinase [Croceicoccus naphthovorans]AKM09435.1 2-keto-3-deoxygluconate kinase [Croceicoccus naphthovorans]MBB3991943.1 2-dehydro-3-deoxygluconokinase [Croceicoccus naphthovorans]
MISGKPVVCFGELLLRLSSEPGRPLARGNGLELAVGGAEANVAIALSSLGWPSRMVSLLPDNPLGRRALAALGEAGVDFAHVGNAAGRMGLYFFEPPSGPIGGTITYDREGSVFARATPEQFDFIAALDGAGLLHVSGITPALGQNGAELALAAVRAAQAAGVPVSFDGNYRANLWDAWDSDPRAILQDLIGQATILFGNHRDVSLLLGKAFSGDGPDRRREAAVAAFDAFPNLQIIASTARTVESATSHRIASRVDLRDSHWQTDEVRLSPIVDRIGTGDAFAAGVLLGWLDGGTAQAMAKSGLALAAMKHGIHGDTIAITRADLEKFEPAGTDVRR